MGLILKHENPVFFLAGNIHLDLYRAGIDLFTFIQILQFSVCLQLFRCNCCQIHQCHGLFTSAQFLADFAVSVIGFLDVICGDVHIRNLCQESGVAAVVRPIGIDHPHFCDGGIPVFCIAEIFLAELNVSQIHGKAIVCNKLL